MAGSTLPGGALARSVGGGLPQCLLCARPAWVTPKGRKPGPSLSAAQVSRAPAGRPGGQSHVCTEESNSPVGWSTELERGPSG